MAITFRSETHAQGLVHNKPSGVVDGDFLLASFALWSDSATVDTLSGWTLVPNCSNLSAGSGPDCRLQSFYKIASSEPSSWTWTVTGVSSGTVGTVTAYEGVNLSTPIDISNGQGNGQSSSVTAPSVDPTGTAGLLIFVGGFPGDAAAPAWTPPGGMTERVDYGLTNVAAVTVCTEQLASGNPTGTRTATYSGSKRNCGQSIVLKPIAAEHHTGSGSVSSTGSVLASGIKRSVGTVSATSTGLSVSSGIKRTFASAQIISNSGVIVQGKKHSIGSSSISNNSVVSVTGIRKHVSSVILMSNSTVSAIGVKGKQVDITVSSLGTVFSQGSKYTSSSVTVSSLIFMAVTGVKSLASQVIITGLVQLLANGKKHAYSFGSITSTGTVSALGAAALFEPDPDPIRIRYQDNSLISYREKSTIVWRSE